MSHDCSSHLHPHEVGMEKLQPLLIWSDNKEVLEDLLPYIRSEFCEEIILLDVEHLPTIKDKDVDKEIHLTLEEYDFHFIKILSSDIELILKDNQRHRLQIGDLESDLEKIGNGSFF